MLVLKQQEMSGVRAPCPPRLSLEHRSPGRVSFRKVQSSPRQRPFRSPMVPRMGSQGAASHVLPCGESLLDQRHAVSGAHQLHVHARQRRPGAHELNS